MIKIFLIVLVTSFLLNFMFLSAQDKKFSVQLNVGYTWFSGVKGYTINDKLGFGSFTNGQIPIEAELRYKITSRFSLNFAYGYGIGLPYTRTAKSVDESRDFSRRRNLSTHTLRIGEIYYFTMTKVRPYIGIDLALLLSETKEKSTTTNPSTTVNRESKIFAGFGLLPKLGLEYSFREKMFLNISVHYLLVVPSNIPLKENSNNYMYTREQQTVSHGVVCNVGVGYRF